MRFLSTILLLASICTTTQAIEKPNFVIIFTDDQGYGDLGCYGSKNVTTPHLDQMAAEGMKLTSFYQSTASCTPSRASLMTGCYANRVGMGGGVLLNKSSRGLNPKEKTIAEVLKTAGYATGMFGKWHLGDQPSHLPTNQGFDEFFGLPYSHDIHPFNNNGKLGRFPKLPMLEGNTVIELEPKAEFLTKRFTERAVKFIEQHKQEPFFLYVPHPIPHRPLHVTDPFLTNVDPKLLAQIEEYERDGAVDYTTRDLLYFQGVNEIDWSVGQILQALKDNGVDENTIVIFMSDNGPEGKKTHKEVFANLGQGTTGPLRGAKGTTFEGGVRTPTVIRWPGKIPANTESSEILTSMDLLPTFAKLAGADLPEKKIDGLDIYNVLIKEGTPSPREFFMYNLRDKWCAIRKGDWKLHTGGVGGSALYNLANDLGETKNIREDHPKIVEELLALRAEFITEMKANSRPAGFVKKPVNLTLKAR